MDIILILIAMFAATAAITYWPVEYDLFNPYDRCEALALKIVGVIFIVAVASIGIVAAYA